MRKKSLFISWLVLFLAVSGFAGTGNGDSVKTDVVTIRIEKQHGAVVPGGESSLAIHFELKKDWHFYASAENAPGGMNLQLLPSATEHVTFSEVVFPRSQWYFDKSSGQTLEVFSDKFTVFLPYSVGQTEFESGRAEVDVEIGIEGAVCSDVQCRVPDFGSLGVKVQIDSNAKMDEAKFSLPVVSKKIEAGGGVGSYSVWFALSLAILAGLVLNIMPCVWPVLPIIVMRIVQQAKDNKGKSVAMGLAFCCGILLFFACLAAANIVLQVFYGTVLQWGDQFREPGFVAVMAMLLVVLALFMFGLFTITVPSSIAGKSGSGKGYSGAVGMGFLAAILSTPCSFAILAVAFAWAQAQPLPLATVAIMLIGVGMAIPYAILTSMPGLLKSIPRPGRWMEIFKQAIGFVLLIIAVKLITALPQVQRTGALYFAVSLSFCVWMWGSWVDYNTAAVRKWLVRIIAVILAVAAGWVFLSKPKAELIKWQGYDAAVIKTALEEKRAVLIKFTADWCLSCQMVEKTVYSRDDIAKLIVAGNVLAIRADTTTKDQPATLALKNVYNEPGVPVSMLFMPGSEEAIRWHGLAFADELKELLEKVAHE